MTMLDQEKIAQQAKKIMDEFMAALDKLEAKEESGISAGLEREDFVREGKQRKPSGEFKERVLKNAPRKKGDFLLAEKKHW